jgi:hypothetical protein
MAVVPLIIRTIKGDSRTNHKDPLQVQIHSYGNGLPPSMQIIRGLSASLSFKQRLSTGIGRDSTLTL